MALITSGSGRLGRDIEIRYSQNGHAFGNVGVACRVPKRNQDGSYGGTEWVELSFIGKAAENAAKILTKGSRIWFVGHPETDEWTDQQNQKRTKQKVVVSQWDVLDTKEESANLGGGGFNQNQGNPNQGGFNPNQPNQGGFNPNQPNQGGFNPNQPNQGGFNPNQPNQGNLNQPNQGNPNQGFGPPPNQNQGNPNQGGGFNPNNPNQGNPGQGFGNNSGGNTNDDVPF